MNTKTDLQLQTELKKAINEANIKDIEGLPARYSWLTPIDPKVDYYKQTRANIVADLRHHFPGTKFSIRKHSYSSIAIYWTNGAALSEVQKIIEVYKEHELNHIDDYSDYKPSNFNYVFGGISYVFANRKISDEINGLTEKLMEVVTFAHKIDANGALFDIVRKTSFPAGAYNFGLDLINKTITYNTPERKK
jgi:hypothetical protein